MFLERQFQVCTVLRRFPISERRRILIIYKVYVLILHMKGSRRPKIRAVITIYYIGVQCKWIKLIFGMKKGV